MLFIIKPTKTKVVGGIAMKQYTADAFTEKVEYITESRHPHLLSAIFAVSAACLVFAVGQILYSATQPFFGMLAIRKSNAFVMLLGILLPVVL